MLKNNLTPVDRALEDVVESYLDDYSLEDLLEEFDINPVDVIIVLYSQGYIDDDKIAEVFNLVEHMKEED